MIDINVTDDIGQIKLITKEQYEEMSSQCRPISSTEGICYVSNDEKYMGEGECKSNMCPVR